MPPTQRRMQVSKQLSIEAHEERIKAFHHAHGTVPGSNDLGAATLAMMLKKYGSWNNAMLGILGKPAERHKWNDDEIILLLKSLYLKNKKFPTWEEVRGIKKSLTETIRTRFGGLDEALEKSIGTSPRLESLKALRDLTRGVANCASTKEVWTVMQSRVIDVSVHTVGMALAREKQAGRVAGSVFGVTTLWKLTAAGRMFLDSKVSEKV
jgi:hypothetical protein